MNVFKYVGIIMACSLLGMACYDDLGNYKYKEINDMIVNMPRSYSVKIPNSDSTQVVVSPKITQTLLNSNSNLRYEWKRQTGRTWTVCGQEETLSFYIYPSDQGNISLVLAVTDASQNIVAYQETTIRLVHAYTNCWFVMQEINGQTVLGAIDGLGEVRVVSKDVYKQETGGSIPGKPLFLSVNNRHQYGPFDRPGIEPVLGVYTQAYCGTLDPSNLSERYSYERMLLSKMNTGFTPRPLYANGAYGGECVIDDGVFWYAFGDGHSIYYPVKLDEEAGSSYYATMADMDAWRCVNIIFDNENKRFLQYSNTDYGMSRVKHEKIDYDKNYALYDVNDQWANGKKLRLLGENPKKANVFDPDHIGGKEVVFMGPTSNVDEPNIIAIARENNGSLLHIYEFNSGALAGRIKDAAFCSGYFTVNIPEAGSKKLSLACSGYFDRMFFYACGNKICRADLNWGVPRVYDILNLEKDLGLPASAEIVALKFCSVCSDHGYYPEGSGEYDDPILYRLPGKLAAVVRNGAEDSIIEMDLTAAGDVKRHENKKPIIYEFKGFENVVDLGYVYRW